MKHLDLFSGIGGFALAAKWCWGEEHEVVAFCEIDNFCQKVLRKNFGDVPIYDDIKKFRITAHSDNGRSLGTIRETLSERENETIADTELSCGNIRRTSVYRQGDTERIVDLSNIDLLTGGFPCQPFSVAGKRKGNEDDRALWPEMLRIIQEVKPRWIIGENVAGFVNMALDQSISDLENEGYEVQTFIIPACAVNAPHRRDRVWIVGNAESCRGGGEIGSVSERQSSNRNRGFVDACHTESGSDRLDQTEHEGRENDTGRFEQVDTDTERGFDGGLRNEGETQGSQSGCKLSGNDDRLCGDSTDPIITGLQGSECKQPIRLPGFVNRGRGHQEPDWSENWIEVATRFCRVDDGVPNRVDRLKGLGNAIVPQVVYEIMKAIKEVENDPHRCLQTERLHNRR